ncbi:MAG TPA: hypothetical protein VM369_09785 [Candidatus Binatia bacterium]|nr:hypothetical protein [Candidatus Binatia bacterium]
MVRRLMLLLPLLLTALPAAAGSANFEGNADLLVGWRGMRDDTAWGEYRDQSAIALQADFGERHFPLNAEVGVHFGVDSARVAGRDVTSTTDELSLGAVWSPWKSRLLRPYLGAGGALVHARVETVVAGDIVSDADETGAWYVHTGLIVSIGRHINVGGDVRMLRGGDLMLFGGTADADYLQVTALAGYSWGKAAAPARVRREPRDARAMRNPVSRGPDREGAAPVGF